MKTNINIKFLDMVIQDNGNGDGLTLVGKDGICEQCSIANFGPSSDPKNLVSAKRYATLWFMVQRPDVFGHSVAMRLIRDDRAGTYHEFYLLSRYCKEHNIAIPEDIKMSSDMNCMITCCGGRI